MTKAFWGRMKELGGAEQKVRCPQLTRGLWHHGLAAASHLSRGLGNVLPEMLDKNNGVQHLLWDVGEKVNGYETLDPQSVVDIGVKGKVSPTVASAVKAILLNLSNALRGQGPSREAKAKPKI